MMLTLAKVPHDDDRVVKVIFNVATLTLGDTNP